MFIKNSNSETPSESALAEGLLDDIVSMHDVAEINQNTLDRIKNAEEIIGCQTKNLLSQREIAEMFLEENIAKFNNTDDDFVFRKAKQAYDFSADIAYLIRKITNSFYSLSSDIPRSGCFNSRKLRENHFKHSVIKADNIHCFLEPDGIFISLPILCSRNYMPGKKKYEEFQGSRSMMFSDSIPAIIMNLSNYDDYDFSKFREKTFNYLFCYQQNSHLVADTDNHEIKAITDAVAMFLPNDDAGAYTDFNLTTRINPSLESLTYLSILPGLRHHVDEEELFAYWAEKQKTLTKIC